VESLFQKTVKIHERQYSCESCGDKVCGQELPVLKWFRNLSGKELELASLLECKITL